MSRATALALCVAVSALGCDAVGKSNHAGRSEAVASASREMSGPSLLSRESLTPALDALRAKAPGKLLRLEIKPQELLLQAEDPKNAGSVVELHYRDGKVSEAEQVTLRGNGKLADNLFDLAEVKLDGIPELSRRAVERIDPDAGSVESVLVIRNLPESDDIRLRVYVSSPHRSGYVDADHAAQLL
jgi:hypothetical protein